MNKKILINPNKTIFQALEVLQKTSCRCLIVVNKKYQLLGTLNDGDIRRSIIKKINLNSKIYKIYKKNCFYIQNNKINNFNLNFYFKKNKINVIPVIDKNKVVVDTLIDTSKEIIKKNIKNNLEILIMAGGLGTRLKPFTNIIPKPLLLYNGKTIIENVINFYSKYDFNKFTISVNYKNILIKSFFREIKPNYKLQYLNEKKPLGTAGVLSKLAKKNKRFLITNCDTLIQYNLNDFISFHEKNNFELTMIVASKINKIPYGVCKVSNNKLKQIFEKPEEYYLANTGVYLVESKVFKNLRKNTNCSFVDLIKTCLKNKIRVGVYPVPELAWKDFGQSSEFVISNNI